MGLPAGPPRSKRPTGTQPSARPAERARPAAYGVAGRPAELEASQRHRDVVRPAALVGERDEPAARLVERLAHGQRRDLAVAHLPVERSEEHTSELQSP